MDSQHRLFVAIALSLLIMVLYQKFFVVPQAQQIQQRGPAGLAGNRIITVSPQEKQYAPEPEQKEQRPTRPEKITALENDSLKIELTDNGARIKQIWLKDFKDTKTGEPTQLLDSKIIGESFTGPFLLDDLFLKSTTQQRWKQVDSGEKHIKYSYKSSTGATVTKEIFFHNSNYAIGLRLAITNNTATALPVKYKLVGGSALLTKPGVDERFVGVDVKVGQEAKRLSPRSRAVKGGGSVYNGSPAWVSVRGRHFSLALEPGQKEQACFVEKDGKKGARSGIIIGPITIEPKDTVAKEFLLYAGPNNTEQLKAVSPNLVDVATFGKLTGICNVLLKLLRFFYGIVHNYGVAIIMLTLLINAAVFPLTRKSLTSMKQMQAMQPVLEEVKKQHKGNPQKLNKEIMELYKKHKVNPLGGCLPMFIQSPVFFSLYLVLMKSVELKGAHFLWIKDLTEADAAFKLPVTLPVLGEYINVLPLLMIVAMFLQQKITQPKAAQTEQQRTMAVMMPLLFGVIFYNLSSGLVLYWLTNTIIMVLLQEFVLKIKHIEPKPAQYVDVSRGTKG